MHSRGTPNLRHTSHDTVLGQGVAMFAKSYDLRAEGVPDSSDQMKYGCANEMSPGVLENPSAVVRSHSGTVLVQYTVL